MAKPPHVLAYEYFKQRYDGDDKVKMFVALGLYTDAEHKWASEQSSWPGETKYKNYYDSAIPHSCDFINESADTVLYEFVQGIVEEEKASFMDAALIAYRAEAAKSHHRWWQGVLEATGGALVWSLILIIGAIVAGRLGIDVIGAFERAAGTIH